MLNSLNNAELLELGQKESWIVNGYNCKLLGKPERKFAVLYCEEEDMLFNISWINLRNAIQFKTFNITL